MIFEHRKRLFKLKTEICRKGIGRVIPRRLGRYEKSVVFVNRVNIVLIFRPCPVILKFLRLSESVNNKIKIVNMQIKRYKSASVLVHHPAVPAPLRANSEPAHMPRKQPAVFARIVYFFYDTVFRPKTQNLRYHKFNVIALCGAVNARNVGSV